MSLPSEIDTLFGLGDGGDVDAGESTSEVRAQDFVTSRQGAAPSAGGSPGPWGRRESSDSGPRPCAHTRAMACARGLCGRRTWPRRGARHVVRCCCTGAGLKSRPGRRRQSKAKPARAHAPLHPGRAWLDYAHVSLAVPDVSGLFCLFLFSDVATDLSILDALCGMDAGDLGGDGEDDDHDHDGHSDDEEDESYDGDGQPRKKRARRTRTELNEIEKQRTRRINEQIQSLRALLEASGLNTKKDKFSILKK